MTKSLLSSFATVILLAAGALLFPAAGGKADTSSTLKIGVTMPLSGPLAAYGESTLRGIRLQEGKINAAGGIRGRLIELVVENNEGDTTKSAEGLRKLIGLDKVVAVVGPITSRNALAIAREAQRKGVALITPTGTNDAITKDGDFIFRACFTDSFQGAVDARFAFEELKIKTVVPFQDTTSDYSVGLCRSFADTFKRLGGTVLPTLSYKQGDTDFTPQLRKIRESGAQGVFTPGYPPELPRIVNQAKELGLTATLLGADGWDNDDLVKNAAKNLVGSYFSAAFSRQNPTPEIARFLALAKSKGIAEPGTFEALGYDALGLVAEAAKRTAVQSTENIAAYRAGLRDALHTLKDYPGATGTISMRPSGDPLKSLVILKYADVNGKLDKTFVKAVNP